MALSDAIVKAGKSIYVSAFLLNMLINMIPITHASAPNSPPTSILPVATVAYAAQIEI